MFNRFLYCYKSGNKQNTTTVNENRAPTDESVRLLKEFEERATEKIYSLIKIDSNRFKVSWYVICEHDTMQWKALCKFQMNEEEHKLQIELDPFQNEEEHFQVIKKAIVDRVSEIILTPACQELAVQMNRRTKNG